MHNLSYGNVIGIVLSLGFLKDNLSFSPVPRRLQDLTFGHNKRIRFSQTKVINNTNKLNHIPSSSELNYAWGGDNYGDRPRSSKTHNINRTCIRHFLTQRSVQSFMFLCEQCRDPHTVKWIEDFSGAHNLLHFHGTGAFNLTRFESWDSFLLEMTEQDKDTMVFRVKARGGDIGGWSKKNPYIKPRFTEFKVDIDPQSLTSRLIAVREQIAEEWINDLDIVIQSGDMVLDSYMDNVVRQRDEEEVDIVSSQKDADDDSPVFERTAMNMMHNINSFADRSSSPLRKGNFDLLMLLATQESIHRVLRNLKETSEESDRSGGIEDMSSSFEWLRAFYIDRVGTYFDGHQRFGRYDDFLEELLRVTPYIKTDGGKHKKSISFIDPLGFAETVIRTRGEVAREWKEIVSSVPDDHMNLRRNLLGKQMNKVVSKEVSVEELENIGEFE